MLFFAYEKIIQSHIYIFLKILFLTILKSKNKCVYKDLQVTFQAPDTQRVLPKALESVWKQVYFSLRLIEIILYLFKMIFKCPSLCSYYLKLSILWVKKNFSP